ncbi:bifunctional 4-hydroxy-2-oxoglutarate aldolase/2-dehydro-3-deoxy-phosphogluconate aldolase [Bacillus sp. ISL-18]|uniref:bifunctional 4-hydroxy-2-oxoglutarate aldolase/2-dehydro-3-deoxy-phosphogluconate aldolase n=1 Tax=Bacillus sp. ISL-18 TaxID=2819118 RepID=UPI001BE723F5|nr:bifunctional 4-hydroxy-2-oxoglutarate aldolase/2-dehydro-3-deoxy-phosphogluconate aldolase [Bacillus sp. ISL-18]MBT2658499.1 bifunctional 4-hydroxy-2-oxoglutarate aldolase/2-dehydro-3-deoxy-phosphogluconate aldolase [Bacillus sp. ISL-18]
MKKVSILNKLINSGVIAVIRADSKTKALSITDALVKGGITGLELTFTVPQAEMAVQEIKNKYVDHQDIVIGAGTVLDAVTARIAIMAGADYIVSPYFDDETAKLCNLYQIPYLPGCMTLTEISTALKAGVDIIKLFPGSALGPEFVSAVKAPMPQVNIMPTGGVNLENMEKWFAKGCSAVGIGGNLIAPDKSGDFDKITTLAKQYIEKLNAIRK